MNIELFDRIDADNASKWDNDIFEKLNELKEKENIILDCDKLEYISSAGLRVLLKIKKKFEDIKLINVSSDVYEILDMTGFTKLFDTSKKLRNISIEGLKPIGIGSTGTVYKLSDDTIIKVFKKHISLDSIKKEIENTKKAFLYGLPTAISFDVVKSDDNYAIVMELLADKTLSEAISENPDKAEYYVEKYAKLMKNMHSIECKENEFTSVKDQYLDQVSGLINILGKEEYEKLINIIKGLPDSNTMLHGDPQPKNIMLQGEELVFIDVGEISLGTPLLDLADIYLCINNFKTDEMALNYVGLTLNQLKVFWNNFKKYYFNDYSPEKIELVENIISYLSVLRKTCFVAKYNFDEMPEEKRNMLVGLIKNYVSNVLIPKFEETKDSINKLIES